MRYLSVLITALVLLTGCARIKYMEELLALQSLSDNQEAQQRYLDKGERQFQDLLNEVKEDRLRMGQSRFSIISRYGKPILITEIENDPIIKEELMYRHPALLFGSEKVFLYFDQKRRLVKAIISPPLNKD